MKCNAFWPKFNVVLCRRSALIMYTKGFCSLLGLIILRCHSPECSVTGMGTFPICKLKWDLLRTSVTACTIDKNTFSPPFGILYVRTEI